MYDVIVRNGQVYDGTGNPWTRLDIGIVAGRIERLGDLRGVEARQDIDADGLAIAPGFIDPHVHSDLLCTRPDIHHIKVLQGITTELLGQDGISVAPVSEVTKPLWRDQLRALDGDIGDWPWHSVDEYLGFLSGSKMAGNVAYLVPHGGVRTLVMGFTARPATPDESVRMRELVETAMQEGAFGVSSGLIYPPNVFSDKAELIEICKGAAKYGGCFVVHIRNESSHCLEALDEVIDVARQSGVRLQVSHFKVGGRVNRDKIARALAKIDAGRSEGIEITFDQYPYTAGSTVLAAVLPPWMHDGGTEEMLRRLSDPDIRSRIERDLAENDTYENWVLTCGWENIVITSVGSDRNRSCEGKTMLEVAKMRCQRPTDAAFDLLVEEGGNATMLIHWGNEDDFLGAMRHPAQMVGSDSIFGNKPHPRLYGTYPRVLGRFVREKGTLALTEAIRKMTAAPAQLLRLKDRGMIREGFWADVVVFDPNTVCDQATYEQPLQEPVGIFAVLVNGQIVVDKGRYTGITAGQVIRRS